MYDRHYKLAVFGDSYADSGPPESKFYPEAYYNRLAKRFRELHPNDQTSFYDNTGYSGASAYWSYYNFRKFVVDLNYNVEHAVMTFTDTQRLPITNKSFVGVSWKNLFRMDKHPLPIEAEQNLTDTDTSPSKNYWESILNQMILDGLGPCPTVGTYSEPDIFSMWNLIFEDNYYSNELTRLISVSCFTESLKIAKSRNVNLVIIIPFNSCMVEYLGEDPDPMITDNFMIITGLDKVSHMETKTWSIDEEYHTNLVKEIRWKNCHVDVRCNHLCATNNKILADLIWEGFKGKTGIYDLSEQPGLNFDEIHNYADIIYND